MNLKKLAAFGGVILGLGLVGKGYAAELVCVNNQEVLKVSSYAKSVQEQILKKKQEMMEEFKKKLEPLKQQMEALQKQIQSGLLSQEAVEEKRKELAKLQQQMQLLMMQAQQEYMRYAEEQYQKLTQLEQAALKALEKTLGFKAVVDCQQLLYYSPEIDITNQTAKVIDQLAKQAK
jgi:Skp family chaperone for outer membrane proteins